MPFAEAYRTTRAISDDLETVILAFESGWRQRAACRILEARRTELLLPLLHAVEDSWLACRDAERAYRRHAFRDTLASVGLWLFIVAVGFAPLTFLAITSLLASWPAGVVAACTVVVFGAWFQTPRVPPWNVQDRRARAVNLATEYLLETIRLDDASGLHDRHHAALLRVLAGCTNERSATCNVMLAVSLLRALEHVGDGRYARRVEHLATHGHGLVRIAATVCYPALRDRQARESRGRVLLRPSGLHSEETLVRPTNPHSIEPANLVRTLDSLEHRAA